MSTFLEETGENIFQTNSENVEMPHSADIGNVPWSTTLLKQIYQYSENKQNDSL